MKHAICALCLLFSTTAAAETPAEFIATNFPKGYNAAMQDRHSQVTATGTADSPAQATITIHFTPRFAPLEIEGETAKAARAWGQVREPNTPLVQVDFKGEQGNLHVCTYRYNPVTRTVYRLP